MKTMTLPSESSQEDTSVQDAKISGSATTKLETPKIPENWRVDYYQVSLRCEEPLQGQAPLEASGYGPTPEEALLDALAEAQRVWQRMEERISSRGKKKITLSVEDLFAEELTVEDLFK